jgi:hypothetical protein
MKLRGRKPVFTKAMKETVIVLFEEGYNIEQIKGRNMLMHRYCIANTASKSGSKRKTAREPRYRTLALLL